MRVMYPFNHPFKSGQLRLKGYERSISLITTHVTFKKYTAITVLPEDVQNVCRRAAAEMVKPGAWAVGGVAHNASGRSADVYHEAVARDGLGWILKVAFDLFEGRRTSRKEIGMRISELIDSQIWINTGNKFRLMTVCDLGPGETAEAFLAVETAIGGNGLPALYPYAKEPEHKRTLRLGRKAEKDDRVDK